MKINLRLFSLAIILLTISCNSAFLKEPNSSREFFESFMKTVIGSDIILNEDCLGGKFDDYSEELEKAISSKDLVGIAFYVNRIAYLEIDKCPIQDVKIILQDFHVSWKNGNTWVNIMKHSDFMKEKIHEFVIDKSKTPSEFGLFVGIMFKALVYGFTQL